MPIDAVILDFDGTLTAPGALDFPAIRRELGCPDGVAILEHLASLSGRSRDAAQAILDRHERRAARRSRANAGAEKLLAWLGRRGIGVGVLTRNGRDAVRTACRAMGWREDFALLVAREDAPPKPHPAGVHQLLEGLGASPGRALVVGDYRFDIEAGRAAGCRTAFLTNGCLPSYSREEVGWEMEIASLEELPGLIESLRGE